MSVEIHSLSLGPLGTNAYLVGDRASGEAVLIDPVGDLTEDHKELRPPRMLAFAAERDLRIALILATHAHWDHVLSSASLQAATDADFYIHQNARPWLEHLPEMGQNFFGPTVTFPAAATVNRWLLDGPETIRHGQIELETRFTPGHSPDHLSFVLHGEKAVFSGDSLFAGGIGRWDLRGGDQDQLLKAIREELFTLPDDYRVFPGHGGPTAIGQERRTNPFLRD